MKKHVYRLICLAVLSTTFNQAAIGQSKAKPHQAANSWNVEEKSIDELSLAMQSGRLTATQLTQIYLSRIKALDQAGPKLNSVLIVNPDALAIAKQLDAERKAGKLRGPLHGIPVLIKDNIDTGDKMATTAGSLALIHNFAKQDAEIVRRMRDAGAIIIGKTNLSEWANFRSSNSTSGWSAVGGLTKNPYVLNRNTCGSSAGTGTAISANLASVGVGTETNGSIVCPATLAGLVGIKPTLGLVSRSGIIPLAHSQDTAGPMTRTVKDAVILFDAMIGKDDKDAITLQVPDSTNRNYLAALKVDGLKGKRIGIVRELFGNHPKVTALLESTIVTLKAQGAEVVEDIKLPPRSAYGAASSTVLNYEFKSDIAAYLANAPAAVPHRSLADLIAFNKAHADKEMPWFAQERFEQAQATGELTDKEYIDALALVKKVSQEGIDKVMDKHKLDALFAPTGGPAWVTDLVNNGGSLISSSTHAAVAGYPNITVPAGFIHELPVGVSFFGRAFSEATLIEIAYGFEQASRVRKAPKYLPTHP
ncbi:MAG: amidase [Candidatus Aquirickettsiella gammari]